MGRKRADGEGSYRHEIRRDKNTGKVLKDIWHFVITTDAGRKDFSAMGKGAKAAAKDKYDAWEESRKAPQSVVVPDITLKDWLTTYLETCRKGTMRDTSYHQLELLADDFPKELQEKAVKDIVPIELQSFINKFARARSK